ncbi:Uncharacterized protein SCF082_LOCUS35009 [Durusdinium trenchii]
MARAQRAHRAPRRACVAVVLLLSGVAFVAAGARHSPPTATAASAAAAAGVVSVVSTPASAETFSLLGKSSAELFPIANAAPLVTWLLLIFFPSWEHLPKAALAAPVFNAVLYVAAIGFLLTHPDPEAASVDLTSLDGIVAAFRNPDGVFAGWLHYCVFDPLVGLGEVLDSQQQKVPHFLVVPCVILTLLFGPMGFLSYLTVRTVYLASKPA